MVEIARQGELSNSMGDPPPGDHGRRGILNLAELGHRLDTALQLGKSTVSRPSQVCDGLVEDLRVEHHPEVRGMRHGELDVCHAGVKKASATAAQGDQSVGQNVESFGRDSAQQTLARTKVMPRSCVAHAKVCRDTANAQPVDAISHDDLNRSPDHRPLQVTVVVCLRHTLELTTAKLSM